MKLDIQYCRVQGDVVLECIILHDDLVREEMVFRVMFNTAFVRGNVLIVQRDEMDMLWDAKCSGVDLDPLARPIRQGTRHIWL